MFFSDEVGIVFEPFSFLHFVLFACIFAGIALIYFNREKIRNSKHERKIAIGMASFALFWEISLKIWQVAHGQDFFADILPIGLCAFTLYLGMFALFFKNRTTFTIGYFWTWGAILSVLFPDISYSVDRFRFYQFMIGHMFFFFMYLYMMFVYKWYPTAKNLIRSVLVLLIITLSLALISHLSNLNLMFTLNGDGTPFEMFEGNGYFMYLMHVILSALVFMTVWYLPFFFYWRKQKKAIA